MKRKWIVTMALIGLIIMSSCGLMISSLLYKDKCKTCRVVDSWGNEVWSATECAGSLYWFEIEEDCKVAAYDKSNYSYSHEDYDCDCYVEDEN